MSESCTDIYDYTDRCDFAKENCEYFFVLYFCALDESWTVYFILTLFVLLCVYLLGSTADQYFSPALAKVAESLKLSSTVAGVTLLAFGNGAPDVFSSILAARKLKVSLSLGGLFGGAFFVSSVVLGRVILAVDICKVDQNKTLRDSSLLILTIILIVFYGLIGTITLFQACLFPILYCFYVFLVLYMERKHEPLLNRSVEMPDMNTNYSQFGEIIEDYILLSPTKLKVMPAIRHDEFEWSQIKEKFFTEKKEKFSELNFFYKVLWAVDYPFTVLREVTIPFYTQENWSRKKLALFPICGSLFVLYTQDRNLYLVFKTTVWGWSVTGLLILISVLAGVCFFCTSKRSVVPAYNDKLMALSFFMSILWIIAICGYMIDAISLLGVVLDMPVSFLGLTLLAWGNSAGDFVANPAITRLGMSQTAVTGCFAGPLFNTLIGFGVSLIVVCSNKNVKFQITDHGQLLIAAAALICTNSLSCYIILKSRGKLRSWYGYTLGGIYFLFFIIVLIYTL